VGFSSALDAFDPCAETCAYTVQVGGVAGSPGPGAHVGGIVVAGGCGAGFAEPDLGCAGAWAAIERRSR
jgi:hypothetical protein